MSGLTAQSPRALWKHGTGVWPGSWGEISPPLSHFCFLGFLPLKCFPLDWVGEQLRQNLPFQAISLCQRRLAHSQDSKHLTTANSSEHVNSFYSHPSLGNRKAKDALVISLVLWISTPPQGLQHIFGSCVHSVLASAVWET